VTIEAVVAFGGVALLGVIGFVYAWFSNRGKTRARHPGAWLGWWPSTNQGATLPTTVVLRHAAGVASL